MSELTDRLAELVRAKEALVGAIDDLNTALAALDQELAAAADRVGTSQSALDAALAKVADLTERAKAIGAQPAPAQAPPAEQPLPGV